MAAQTGTNFYSGNGKNRIGTALSTNIVVKVNNNAIGAVQTISYTEQRAIYMLNEVGTDGHVDSAPQSSVKITGSCTRVRFDRLRIVEAFGRGYVHAHAQRYPFDIDIFDTFKGDGENTIVTTLRNVWINNIQTSYGAENFVVSEQMQFDCESIESHFAGGANNAATGGERGLVFFNDEIEREADRGGRRGSMDAPGLINAFLNRNPF